MDKSQLIRPTLQEEDVVIPGKGTVRVRGLTRKEMAKIQGMKGPQAERVSLSIALVDPVLTLNDVNAWLDNSPAMECQPAVEAINRLSGMGRNADPDRWKRTGDEPDAGV